ncbi:proline iminopeptidase-family hydrolase [Lactiplantibacillus argentoratensis]|uniref:proline iminopeptidase-family hydrolase n=1 Tax=Lactiplantibacillus argentoratensis TaxID=271881 RepID=UPI001BDD4F20|nr:proline iminopeptidase-family hydrolase [Lactiplantibacillus argentoratensis]MBT1142634.1 proline iminopeptidase-family hydrolase [Lactiplantibacillus argentoratensis]MBT1145492.1 proline iminopeptidase-family hydrolase [Lactiplantibacillus argentoratensis]MBT1148249.1 proline iminopeptidase-family hydrolase [Lactiplantibacillus argentoratensis]MBT1153422.1 proline iminopeptidase-family hydrolase [Lactiplantibacillus argentoratensis]
MLTGTHLVQLKNGFHLFTRTVGHGPVNVLCVHGGPGSNHTEFENFATELGEDNFQVSMYDQLGSFYSDQPDFSRPENQQFLSLDYYLSELEEVRQQLGLEDFYLLGHSWGGLLAQEYALKYGQHLKGLIIMSMIDNIAEYTPHVNKLREQTLTASQVSYMQGIENAEAFDDPEYQRLVTTLNQHFVCRHPENAPRQLVSTLATPVYNYFQGNNEFVMVGALNGWDQRANLHKIMTPTLLTFGEYDTMPLSVARRMQRTLPKARLTLTPDGGHCHSVDNPTAFFHSLRRYLTDVETNQFTAY